MRRVDTIPAQFEMESQGAGLHRVHRNGFLRERGGRDGRHVHDGNIALGSQPGRHRRDRPMDRQGICPALRGLHFKNSDVSLGERRGQRGRAGAGHPTGRFLRRDRRRRRPRNAGISDPLRKAALQRRRPIRIPRVILAVRWQRHGAHGVPPRGTLRNVGLSHAHVGSSRLSIPVHVRDRIPIHHRGNLHGRRELPLQRRRGHLQRRRTKGEMRPGPEGGSHLHKSHVEGLRHRPVRPAGPAHRAVRGVDRLLQSPHGRQGIPTDIPLPRGVRFVRDEFGHYSHWDSGQVSICAGSFHGTVVDRRGQSGDW
mmetsp:Transcript_37887/g.64710  ORF Transcript_37887/g.64710 Transcript_37887/m.64710 type:complete len:311 (+) Transcript_37887:291-1223(+)